MNKVKIAGRLLQLAKTLQNNKIAKFDHIMGAGLEGAIKDLEQVRKLIKGNEDKVSSNFQLYIEDIAKNSRELLKLIIKDVR